MSSVTSSTSGVRDTARIAVAARAVVAALLAIATTFNADHSASWGLVVFGIFQIAQAGVVGYGIRSLARSTAGRRLAAIRAVLGALCGVLALLVVSHGLGALVALGIFSFLWLGVLELAGGLRSADATRFSVEQRVVGGLSLLLGLLYAVIPAADLWVVGALGAWGAIVAVYLGIAAASPKPASPTPSTESGKRR